MQDTAENLQNKLNKCLQILRLFDWLIDSYVLDFYVDQHWNKLPLGWRKHFDAIQPEHLVHLLESNNERKCKQFNALPLALSSLKVLLQGLCLPRNVDTKYKSSLLRSNLLTHNKLKHTFTKCVKPKKLHEISEMAAICKRSADDLTVDFVVDFGAGLGHLARVLGYAYNVRVCCLEMQNDLNIQANVIDEKFQVISSKCLTAVELSKFQTPTHVSLRLTSDIQAQQFITTLQAALKLPNNNFRFGIIGLHPCGDLGPILMRLFLGCAQAKFLNFVGCCYMKLTTAGLQNTTNMLGYPLSQHLQRDQIFSYLSYEAMEISCHASEIYCDRLFTGNYEYLKVHSFRAAAERILCANWPSLKHCGLKSVKHVPGMEFEEYFYKAVQGLEASKLPMKDLKNAITMTDLSQWKRVVIFYTLRLMFAPLVESIVLYDRMLYLMENDCQVEINAIFDPRVSPRNHITSAVKQC